MAANNEELEAMIDANIAQVIKCAPNAVAITKALMHRVAQGGFCRWTACSIRRPRISHPRCAATRGARGTSAFVEKRKPAWNVGWKGWKGDSQTPGLPPDVRDASRPGSEATQRHDPILDCFVVSPRNDGGNYAKGSFAPGGSGTSIAR